MVLLVKIGYFRKWSLTYCDKMLNFVNFKNGGTCVHLSILDEFVCVEVLRPSQPNEVLSSAVSLPNHTFTGQA